MSMTPTGKALPRTAAGRELLALFGTAYWAQPPWQIDMEKSILAIEAEAAARTVALIENEGVVTWGDEGHRARFLAANPPAATAAGYWVPDPDRLGYMRGVANGGSLPPAATEERE